MKLVMIGDGESPHLLKWARALAPKVELWVASSRSFLPGFDGLVPEERRYAMQHASRHGGGNWTLLQGLPALARWLQRVDADWLHAHYLTSHGTLAWVARRGWRLRGRIAGSAWGSDILVTPQQGWAYRWLTRQVLAHCDVCTSDSEHMSAAMQRLGAAEVMTFPFGLEALPRQNARKEDWLFFANRGLEPIYRPERVLQAFAAIAARLPMARLVVANDGSLRESLQRWVQQQGLANRVEFVGRLDAQRQAGFYARARWFLSLPESDSVSVSVIEAMAHECVPLLSDLPANHELLRAGRGLILSDTDRFESLPALLAGRQAEAAADGALNRAWVAEHALFGPAVERFLQRLQAFPVQASR